MMIETQMRWSITKPDFFRKIFLFQTLEKWVKIWPKKDFFLFYEIN